MAKPFKDRFDEFKNFMRNRVKNRYLWVAVIALVAIVVGLIMRNNKKFEAEYKLN